MEMWAALLVLFYHYDHCYIIHSRIMLSYLMSSIIVCMHYVMMHIRTVCMCNIYCMAAYAILGRCGRARAYASHCLLDSSDNNRPVMGYINICPAVRLLLEFIIFLWRKVSDSQYCLYKIYLLSNQHPR